MVLRCRLRSYVRVRVLGCSQGRGKLKSKGLGSLSRHSDDSTECGIDKDPSSGTDCKPYPKKQKVCGLCGILSDSSYPTGGFLVK